MRNSGEFRYEYLSFVAESPSHSALMPNTSIHTLSREDNSSHMLYLWTVPFQRKGTEKRPD